MKFFNEPIKFFSKKFREKKISFKISPIDLKRRESESQNMGMDEESVSRDMVVGAEKWWPVVEIAVMNEKDHFFKAQEPHGHVYEPNEHVIVQAQMIEPTRTVSVVFYLISIN